jgi:ribulose-phosphate 3-epimerase
MLIAPSILNANFGQLQAEIDSIKTADRIHLDIMDGHYVPSLTIGAGLLKSIDFHGMPVEVHLMVNEPENFFYDFLELGVMGITFHIENTGTAKALELLADLKSCGVAAGVCIDGYTSSDFLSDEILDLADQILVMGVKAGAGGQPFMPEALEKIKKIRARGYKKEIELDGGAKLDNMADIKAAGCDISVVGSYLMKVGVKERQERLKNLQAI